MTGARRPAQLLATTSGPRSRPIHVAGGSRCPSETATEPDFSASVGGSCAAANAFSDSSRPNPASTRSPPRQRRNVRAREPDACEQATAAASPARGQRVRRRRGVPAVRPRHGTRHRPIRNAANALSAMRGMPPDVGGAGLTWPEAGRDRRRSAERRKQAGSPGLFPPRRVLTSGARDGCARRRRPDHGRHRCRRTPASAWLH